MELCSSHGAWMLINKTIVVRKAGTNFYFFPLLQHSMGDSCTFLWDKHVYANHFFLEPSILEEFSFEKNYKSSFVSNIKEKFDNRFDCGNGIQCWRFRCLPFGVTESVNTRSYYAVSMLDLIYVSIETCIFNGIMYPNYLHAWISSATIQT